MPAIADAMDRVNPIYIPRNQLVEPALAAATEGDLGPFDALLEVVTRPFEERPGREPYERHGAATIQRSLSHVLRHLT